MATTTIEDIEPISEPVQLSTIPVTAEKAERTKKTEAEAMDVDPPASEVAKQGQDSLPTTLPNVQDAMSAVANGKRMMTRALLKRVRALDEHEKFNGREGVDGMEIEGIQKNPDSPRIPKILPRLRLSFSRRAAQQSAMTERLFVFRPNESFILSPHKGYKDFSGPYLKRNHLIPAYPAITESEELSIELIEREGSGSLSDGYRGIMRRRGGIGEPGVKVIVKLTSPSAFVEQQHWRFDHEKAMSRIRNEAKLYCTNLAPLQGDVVPVYYGFWQMTQTLWTRNRNKRTEKEHTVFASVLEDVGDPLFEKEKREAFIMLYIKLSLASVYHSAIKSVHTRKGPDGKGRLIDFEKSYVRKDSKEYTQARHSVAISSETVLALEAKTREEWKAKSNEQ
ncbi:hypothetical protein IAT38_003778 [Cryptococcus sp. DSM 104549]